MLPRYKIWLVLILGGMAASCGYRFVGSGNLPEGIRHLSVEILSNRTSETGLETIFTNDIIYEFTRRQAYAAQQSAADASLSGGIVSIATNTVSRRGQSTSLEQRVHIALDLQLKDTTGRVLWSVKGISGNETYDVGTSKAQTDQNRRDAVSELSKRMAESVYNRITDDF